MAKHELVLNAKVISAKSLKNKNLTLTNQPAIQKFTFTEHGYKLNPETDLHNCRP
jgi:hypothetical protein